jgi:proliferating cell nuclear antigen PCNA
LNQYNNLSKMKLIFANARSSQQFATLFAHLKNFTDNLSLYFRPHELYIQCLDDSHCCLFECRLAIGWFKEYTFDPMTDQGCIGINIAMLNKVLTTWHESQELSIEVEPSADKIFINFENSATAVAGHFNKYFELPLVNLENELMDAYLFETLVDLTVDSKIFCSLISQLTIFDNTLTLTFNEEHVECVSSGNEGSMTARINVNEVKEYAIPESTTLKQSYSLRYVQMMCQFNKLSAEMELGFSEDKPMTLKYVLGETGGDNASFVRFHLAPKIGDNEV